MFSLFAATWVIAAVMPPQLENMPISLSRRTTILLESCIPVDARDEITAMLIAEVSENIPWNAGSTSEDMERIRFAIIKLTLENRKNLTVAIDQAQRDWRNLLMMADFADDIHEHLNWFDRITANNSVD